MIVYRDAEIRDLNPILELETQCYDQAEAEESAQEARPRSGNNEANLVSIIEGRCGCAIVAIDEDIRGHARIVGAVIALDHELKAWDEPDHEILDLISLFVHGEYRRQGIGHKLVELADAWARAREYRYLQGVVYLPNEGLRRLLSTQGLEPRFELRRKTVNEKVDAAFAGKEANEELARQEEALERARRIRRYY